MGNECAKIICHNEFYRAVAPFPNEWKERWVNEVDVFDRIDMVRIDRIIYMRRKKGATLSYLKLGIHRGRVTYLSTHLLTWFPL